MVRNAGASSVEPVVNPGVREARRQRLIRMTKEQIAGRTGPVRQVRYRDEVVSPLALELECRKLLLRAQRAIATVVASGVYAGDLRGTVDESVLRQNEWEIAVALREITELLLDLVASSGGGPAGPMTAAVLLSQNRAITIARDGATARVLALELLAAQVAAAEAARRDWETAHRMAANNDKYLDLVARTAADQHATAEITGLAEQAAEAAQAFRETLQRAAEAAEALALPEPRLPLTSVTQSTQATPGLGRQPARWNAEPAICGSMAHRSGPRGGAAGWIGPGRARRRANVTCGSAGRPGNEISETSRSTFSTIS
jgi:hypothetical protein